MLRIIRLPEKQATVDPAWRLNRVARCVDHGQIGNGSSACFTDIPSIQSSAFSNVGKHHVDLRAVLKTSERIFAALRLDYIPPGGMQMFRYHHAQKPLILDYENGWSPF